MHKPQRPSSIGQRKSSVGHRESLRGVFRRSSSMAPKNTPLLRKSTRQPLSSVKTNQRESYVGTSNQHAVKDPRPLQDKSYMKKCILEIIQILGSLNFPNTITPKMFNPPSTKEYQRIFEFLTFEMMGNFRILGKADEEMLKALKELGYPYGISKSTLSNVGAMSCWPHALGALMWLADLARYCHGIDDAVEETLSLNSRKMLKQEFHSRCYQEFMCGNDGPFVALTSQLKTAVDELDADALKSVDKLKFEQSKITREYEQKMQEKEVCCNLAEEIETKRSNIQKMQQYLSQCDDYIAVMKSKEKEVLDAIKAKEEEIESENQMLVQLKSQVAQQEMSPADIEKVVREKHQVREAKKASLDRLEQLKSTNQDLFVQIGKLTAKADELVANFNNEFKKIPSSLPHVRDHLPTELIDDIQTTDFALAQGHKGLENEALLTNKIQPFLSTLNSKMLEIVGTTDTNYYTVRKRVKQDEETITDLTKQKEQLNDQYQKLLKEAELQKEELQKAQDENNAKICKAETSLEQIKSAHSESIEDLVTKLNDLREKGKKDKERHIEEQNKKKNALDRLAVSVQQFQITLHERAEKMKISLDEIEKEGLAELERIQKEQ